MTVSEPISHVERAMSNPPIARLTRRRTRREVGFDDGLMGMALLLGPANVIMQLARPGVGYGVMESRVESGRVDLHPIKRAAPLSPILRWRRPVPTRRRPRFAAR
jgi:uncharacterized protein (DUF2236 family)